MTEKLYYLDSHLFEFEAAVLEERRGKRGWEIVLDRTAFFPVGGGQPYDTGVIGPARVLEVHERGGEIVHLCDAALAPGAYACAVDREKRLRRMQNHSGEHVFSGLTHKRYGAENVGFHMAADCMTIDFDRELSFEQLSEIEYEANLAVRANIPVRTFFPSPEELAAMEYRSKKELDGAVRIVEIEGIDRCACCAPHVRSTGEIGLVKLLGAERHRGGVRLSLLCGMDALDDYRRKQNSAAAISALLSAKRDEIAPAVERVLESEAKLKERASILGMRYAALRADMIAPTEEHICLFDEGLSEAAGRELVNRLAEKTPGAAALFLREEAGGWRYIIGSRRIDLRAAAKAINAGVSGRGGGRPEMIQGSAAAEATEIEAFFRSWAV
ncbi:MAG: hypothetical protein IKD61_02210 [Oscillospiraceae bacterium]|nr:hypothetical protein [Oscillospiraceae bacterium]